MQDKNNFSEPEYENTQLQVQKSATVSEDYFGKRLDQVAAELFDEFSRSRLQQWIKTGQLKVNGLKLRRSKNNRWRGITNCCNHR